jgi:hypothetical protein
VSRFLTSLITTGRSISPRFPLASAHWSIDESSHRSALARTPRQFGFEIGLDEIRGSALSSGVSVSANCIDASWWPVVPQQRNGCHPSSSTGTGSRWRQSPNFGGPGNRVFGSGIGEVMSLAAIERHLRRMTKHLKAEPREPALRCAADWRRPDGYWHCAREADHHGRHLMRLDKRETYSEGCVPTPDGSVQRSY